MGKRVFRIVAFVVMMAVPVAVGLGVISLTAGPGRVDADFGPGSAWIVGWSLLVAFQLASGISLFVRRRHAVGVERAQLGWVVLPLVLLGGAVATTAAYVVWSVATGRPEPGDAVWTPVYVTLLLFPLTFGIAILRYRLYSIDRIISRTLSYGLITAMLLGIYLGAIFVLGAILPEQGDLAVAGSTLVAAALANPLRTHVQHWVDRRFNRTRFNAELTLEAHPTLGHRGGFVRPLARAYFGGGPDSPARD